MEEKIKKPTEYTQEEFDEFTRRWNIACERIWNYARGENRREEDDRRAKAKCASGERFT